MNQHYNRFLYTTLVCFAYLLELLHCRSQVTLFDSAIISDFHKYSLANQCCLSVAETIHYFSRVLIMPVNVKDGHTRS